MQCIISATLEVVISVSKKVLSNVLRFSSVIALGILFAAGITFAANTTWQGTTWITDGSVISATKMQSNFDYLYERVNSAMSNVGQVNANTYCDVNGGDCFQAQDVPSNAASIVTKTASATYDPSVQAVCPSGTYIRGGSGTCRGGAAFGGATNYPKGNGWFASCGSGLQRGDSVRVTVYAICE